MTSEEVVRRHESAGRRFRAAGVESFLIEAGAGEPAVCMHGVPASSFLYRKIVAELAGRDLRGLAFDLPGLGLAERPSGFDYSWSGLGRFAIAAVDALELERFHLVVHDVGGPVGFELARAMPERVRSLTVLDTVVDVASLRRPWTMQPFALPVVGDVWLRSMAKPLFVRLMYLQGILDRAATPVEEIEAYVDLLKRDDGGRAFLRIMRGFERTPAKQALYRAALHDVPYPVQVVWGAQDPVLKLASHGEAARRAASLTEVHALPAKHFLQEDQAPAVAARVAELAATA